MIGIGDVLVTRGSGWADRLIRLGAALEDEPDIDNHVAIVHHQDKAGTWWAIEGRPGGVGWVDAHSYLASSATTNNVGEPKTGEQRQMIATGAEGMLGVAYDWSAIITDGLMVTHLNEVWTQNWNGQGPPAHVVCSSLAAYLYERAGLDRPTIHEPRYTTPGDWEQFIIQHNYAEVAH
ncbi:MAG: hypothetical protein ACRDRL_11965 [Sciscionella sp.]